MYLGDAFYLFCQLKFIHSEKATKYMNFKGEEISKTNLIDKQNKS